MYGYWSFVLRWNTMATEIYGGERFSHLPAQKAERVVIGGNQGIASRTHPVIDFLQPHFLPFLIILPPNNAIIL